MDPLGGMGRASCRCGSKRRTSRAKTLLRARLDEAEHRVNLERNADVAVNRLPVEPSHDCESGLAVVLPPGRRMTLLRSMLFLLAHFAPKARWSIQTFASLDKRAARRGLWCFTTDIFATVRVGDTSGHAAPYAAGFHFV
jgi:hypothetical protein